MSRSFFGLVCAICAAFGGFVVWQNRTLAREAQASALPKLLPVHRLPVPKNAQTATFAGGCFWGVEETFRVVPGVVNTQAGYTGGTTVRPTYRTVHADTTGHVEAVRVVYDPARVSYKQLLSTFFAHRPVTALGASPRRKIGSAYRDMVFTASAAQANEAKAFVCQLKSRETANDKAKQPRRDVVGIVPARAFWPAEEEHQRYYEKRGGEAATGAACRL